MTTLAEWIVAPVVVGALLALGWLAFTKPKKFTKFAPKMLYVLGVPTAAAVFLLSMLFVLETLTVLEDVRTYDPGAASYMLDLMRERGDRASDTLTYLLWVLGGVGGFLLYVGALALFTMLLHPEIYGSLFRTRVTIKTYPDGRVTVHEGPEPSSNDGSRQD